MWDIIPGSAMNAAPTIMQNGNRSQDKDNLGLNQASYDLYFFRLLDLAMSVFRWENLPEGVDERMLEYWLLRDGFCGFFFDEALKEDKHHRAPEGFAVLPMLIQGEWDIYNYPSMRTAYAVNGFKYPCNEDNSVIVFNDYLRVPIWPSLELYARRLAEIDRTIDVNVMAQKTPKIIRCDDKQRLTFKNLAMNVQGNQYWVWADKNVDLKDVEVLDTSAPYIGNEMQILKHQIWNEALTFLGIENVTTEKKERLITNEVMSNMGDVEAQRFVRLNARKQACTQINELFGLEVNCEFRSGIYIKADGYGSRELATEGMIETPMRKTGNTGYETYSQDEMTMVQRLKNALGMEW